MQGQGEGRSAYFPAPEPGSPEPPLPWAVPSAVYLSPPGLHFTNSFLRETSWAQGGRISVSLSLGGREGEGEERKEGQREAQARLWEAINGEWEITFSVCTTLTSKLPPTPPPPGTSVGLCCGPGWWSPGQGITLGCRLRGRGTEGVG